MASCGTESTGLYAFPLTHPPMPSSPYLTIHPLSILPPTHPATHQSISIYTYPSIHSPSSNYHSFSHLSIHSFLLHSFFSRYPPTHPLIYHVSHHFIDLFTHPLSIHHLSILLSILQIRAYLIPGSLNSYVVLSGLAASPRTTTLNYSKISHSGLRQRP